jgi:gluconokinase
MSDVVVVMGVSSVGKTTVAKGLSALMGWEFAEGDAFHPQANIDKMHAGTPLTDDDRWPWLRLIRDWMAEAIDEGRSAVVTCLVLSTRSGPGVTGRVPVSVATRWLVAGA